MTTAPTFSDTTVWPADGVVDLDALAEDEDQDPGAGPDPEAPYGRFANGNPRKHPPTPRSSGASRVPPAPRKRKPAAKKTTTKPKAPAGPDYVAASAQVLGVVQGMVGAAATMTRNPALQLDTMTLVYFGEQLAQASADFAVDTASWASFLERATSVSKWGNLATLGMVVSAQLAVNHGVMPPGLFGAKPPEVMVQMAQAKMAEMEATLAAQMAGGAPASEAA